MALVSIQGISVAYGHTPLFHNLLLQIERGDRICLLGRNGAGKSTLLKVIQGHIIPDRGEVIRQPGLRAAYLPQEVPQDLRGPVRDLVADGYRTWKSETGSTEGTDPWHVEQQVDRLIARMGLEAEAPFENLSAGLKRRVLLARGLIIDPDILLLDEPTNHLDIDAIVWLEDFLQRYDGTLLFVTHDRMFLRKLATRIVELDRGSIVDWSCDYDTFLQRRQALLDAELESWRRLDKKLSQEEAWIRQGTKARRTRNEGRVRALEKLREERRQRRDRIGALQMQVQEAGHSGKLVVEAKDVSYRYADRPIIEGLSTMILRGDRVGIMGPNGSGKTTLLRLLLGELSPLSGSLRHGVRLQTAYFDQLRDQLDEARSVQDNVADGNDTVMYNNKPRHVIGYLQDFLFPPEKARSPVSVLSGGERNRLLLARLFSKPSNVLVLDEPTNDLDAETLELLEDRILEYSGTVFLVSHDRTFLNNVVTSTLVFEGEGKVTEYVGGYDDWIRQRRPESTPKEKATRDEKRQPRPQGPRKLTFKERQELERLPEHIEALEAEQKALFEAMADPEFYRQESSRIVEAKTRLDELQQELQAAYERWEALDAIPA